MAKRWTPEEETEWLAFFSGTGPIPKGRNLHCALRRLEPGPIADLGEMQVAHATATAAMRHLPRLPYKREGDPLRFVEAVQAIAVKPWLGLEAKHPWPADIFAAAVSDARGAVRG